MGKDAIDKAVYDLRRRVNDSVTEKLPLVGADGYFALAQQTALIASQYGIDEKIVTHLLNRYGSMISEILELVSKDKKLSQLLDPTLNYLKAEIVYAAMYEGAMSVDDVLSRRTRLAFEAPEYALHLAAPVADLIAPVLGWGVREKKASISEYQKLAEAERQALEALINS